DISQSVSEIKVDANVVSVLLKLNLLELGYVDSNGDGVVSYDELDTHIDRIYSDVKQHYAIHSSSPLVRVSLEHYGVAENHIAELSLRYIFEKEIGQLEVDSTLFQI